MNAKYFPAFMLIWRFSRMLYRRGELGKVRTERKPPLIATVRSKNDVSDCQWFQYLHSVELRAPFRPLDGICAIRTLWRHRGGLLEMAAE
jgi:hypothetical protein